MSLNTKVRHVLLTSAIALTVAAPSAFAMHAGTIQGGVYTEAGGTPDAPAATFSRALLEKRVEPSAVVAASGRWQGGFYTEARGTPDAPAATYSKQVIEKNITPSIATHLASQPWVPVY